MEINDLYNIHFIRSMARVGVIIIDKYTVQNIFNGKKRLFSNYYSASGIHVLDRLFQEHESHVSKVEKLYQ
jgi:hypothetical protein